MIILLWEESRQSWLMRGYAHNVWLHIDTENKTFSKRVHMGCDCRPDNVVRVKAKADIEGMIRYLKRNGYKGSEV